MNDGDAQAAAGRGLPRVLFTLFAAGWAANHFTALIPVLRTTGRYPAGSLEVAFGLYALGLLPSLLCGGALADRHSPRRLALIGTVVAASGNLVLLLFTTPIVTDLARFVIGIGVGLAISSGTAWAGRIRPHGGSVLAGTVLTAGFGLGPLTAGIVASLTPVTLAITAPVSVSLVLSLVAVILLLGVRSPSATAHPSDTTAPQPQVRQRPGLSPVLWRALPMALWVFACATVTFVSLAGRLDASFSGPLATGFIAFITLGTGVFAQVVARRLGIGPGGGIVGALLAAIGFTIAAFAGDPASPGLVIVCAVVFGGAYGLCLRTGLMDIELLAPPRSWGLVGGIYYVATYTGFALPSLLISLEPIAGQLFPLLAIAVLAAATVVLRIFQLRRAEQ